MQKIKMSPLAVVSLYMHPSSCNAGLISFGKQSWRACEYDNSRSVLTV